MQSTNHVFPRVSNVARFTSYLFAGTLIVVLAACQPTATPQDLPTLAVLPSLTPSEASSSTPVDTDTPAPTSTPTNTPTFTPTPPPTRELRPTNTPLPTVEPTLAAIGTATEAVLAAATYVTFTPAPGGTTVPEQLATVRITEPQFQKEVDAQLSAFPSIQSAIVSFVPSGINVQLTALGGAAFITGNVFISFQVSNGLAAIQAGEITVNAPEPPEGYVEVITTDFLPMMVGALDSILKTRLGPEQKLADIILNNDEMLLTLVVPQ